MADELKINIAAIYEKDGDALAEAFESTQDVATAPRLVGSEATGTGANISKGPIGSFGKIIAVNQDDTDYIELSWDGGSNYFAKIFPGDFAVLHPPHAGATNLWARASANTPVLTVYAFSP